MQIKVSMLIDFLTNIHLPVSVNNPDTDNAIKGIRPLFPDSDDFECNYIYIGNIASIFEVAGDNPDSLFIFVSSSSIPAEKEIFPNLLILNTDKHISSVFNLLQDWMNKLKNWYAEMKLAIAENMELQCLFDLTEPIIGNPTVILDPGQRVLAVTANLPAPDEIFERLREVGYHSEATLAHFRSYRYFEQLSSLYEKDPSAILLQEPFEGSPHITANTFLTIDEKTLFTLTMICSQHKPTDGLLDLFKIFIHLLNEYCKKNYKGKTETSTMYEYFFMDLLNNRITDDKEIQERAKYHKFDINSSFRLIVMRLQNKDYTMSNLALKDFFSIFPEMKPFIYQDDIVLILSNTKNHFEITENVIERLSKIASKYRMWCGISNVFTNFKSVPNRYVQASAAIITNMALAESSIVINQSVSPLIARFEDIYVYYMIITAGNGVGLKRLLPQGFLKMVEYDKNHHMDNCQLLETYLNNERKATITSKILHMHRNNVIYRITRIEELFGFSLDNPETRLKLQLAFLVFKFTALLSK